MWSSVWMKRGDLRSLLEVRVGEAETRNYPYIQIARNLEIEGIWIAFPWQAGECKSGLIPRNTPDLIYRVGRSTIRKFARRLCQSGSPGDWNSPAVPMEQLTYGSARIPEMAPHSAFARGVKVPTRGFQSLMEELCAVPPSLG